MSILGVSSMCAFVVISCIDSNHLTSSVIFQHKCANFRFLLLTLCSLWKGVASYYSYSVL